MKYEVPENAIGATLRLYYEDISSRACGKKPKILPKLSLLCIDNRGSVEFEVDRIVAYDFCHNDGSKDFGPTAVILDTTVRGGLEQCFYWHSSQDPKAHDWVAHRIFDARCFEIRSITLTGS
jgi:hypothetical protein